MERSEKHKRGQAEKRETGEMHMQGAQTWIDTNKCEAGELQMHGAQTWTNRKAKGAHAGRRRSTQRRRPQIIGGRYRNRDTDTQRHNNQREARTCGAAETERQMEDTYTCIVVYVVVVIRRARWSQVHGQIERKPVAKTVNVDIWRGRATERRSVREDAV